MSRDATLSRRRFSFSVPQLLAASIALILMSGGGAWLALHVRESITPTPSVSASTSRPRITEVATWSGRTDAAIADLQVALTQNESRLDTATVRIVRQNLALIDRAMSSARQSSVGWCGTVGRALAPADRRPAATASTTRG